MRSLRLALAPLALALALPSALAAQQTPPAADAVRVVVFPFSAFVLGQSPGDLSDVLRSMILTEIMAQPRLQTFERARVDALHRERREAAGRFEDGEAAAVCRMLGAEYAFVGGLSISGKTARLDVRVIDAETAEVVHAYKQTARAEQFPDLVSRIMADLVRLPLKARVAEVATPVASAFAYSRGLDYEQRGERARAAEMYREALRLFPSHPDAKAALARVN